MEALSARRAYRCIAEGLSQRGLLTLQFDYCGTGDSSGDPSDEVSIKGWLSDIGSAIDFMRKAGVSRVGLIGLRLGATLAALAAADNDAETLVLWDPCETGRGFLREQQMLGFAARITPEESRASKAELEIPGLLLPGDLARSVGTLRLDDALRDLRATQLLLLTRPDRPPRANLKEHLSRHDVKHAVAVGQERFIGVEPGAAILPERVIGEIVSWQSHKLDGERTPVRAWSSACRAGKSGCRAVTGRRRRCRKDRPGRHREPFRNRHRAGGCGPSSHAGRLVHKRRCSSAFGARASLGQDGS